MKISPCIADIETVDPSELRVGYQMEVSQIPRIGEKIKMKMNLFDHVFSRVHNDYTSKVIFNNGVTEGVVVDVVHAFRTMVRPLHRPQRTGKAELVTSIHSDDDFDLEQVVFVVIDFQKGQ